MKLKVLLVMSRKIYNEAGVGGIVIRRDYN
jgi:hypothetical protein